MQTIRNLFILTATLMAFSSAEARDTRLMLSYLDAISSPIGKEKLGNDIEFHFGVKKHSIKTDFGEFATNKKTNAFNKSDDEACRWAFLSAMISLRDQARKQGGNAVIDIRSNYKSNLIDNDRQFECGAGGVMAGVALKGRVVTLKPKTEETPKPTEEVK